MKKFNFFQLLIFMIILFYAVSAHSTTMYITRGDGTWHDANKTGTDDSRLCWAAAASNILDWGGWGDITRSGKSWSFNETEIFGQFIGHWTNDGGITYNGWSWWLNGTVINEGGSTIDVAGGGNWWPLTDVDDYLKTFFAGNYRTEYAMDYIGNYLWWGLGTTILINDGYGGGHALTVWGYEYGGSNSYDYIGIYYTDSDDNQTALRYCDVTLSSARRWYLSGDYDYWYITGVYGLYENDFMTKFVPKSRPVPEPSSVLLLLVGVCGLLINYKRNERALRRNR